MVLFDKEVYIKRREVLKKNMHSSGIILLMGNEESSMNYKDNCYPFRQDSTFLYYFGLDYPGLSAVIDMENNQEIIFGKDQDIDDIIWSGPVPTLSELASKVGILKSKPIKELPELIKTTQSLKKEILFLPPYRPENKIKLSEWTGVPLCKVSEMASIKLVKSIILQRSIKESIEIEEMDKAVSISVDMQIDVIRNARAGVKEYELAALAQQRAIFNQGNFSYPPIITIHGEILHSHNYNNELKDGQLLLCDIGAENRMHYAGDLTRTIPVTKKFTALQKEMYSVVLSSMEHAIGLLQPGVSFKFIHIEACKKLMEGLKLIGLVKGDIEESVSIGAHTLFFQCGLGHMIGLDVHDMEDFGEEYVGYSDTIIKSKEFGLKSLRLARELKEGYTLTVEPGIYIIPELIDQYKTNKKFQQFINFDRLNTMRDFGGIRIEDNFVICENGSKRLGKYLPKTIHEIEELKN